ncbi:MAG: sigma-54 dependent transcriptional regulator [Bacteroidota bacterium]
MEKGNILIVDDEEDILLSLQMFLSIYFDQVDTEARPTQLPNRLEARSYDLILLDMNFKKGETSGDAGLKWLSKIKELSPHTSVIMMTAYAEVPTAVDAVKRGAVDFIEKPWRNEKLLATVLSAFQLSQSKQAITQLETKQRQLNQVSSQPNHDMIGQSAAMEHVFRLIEKVAQTDANVLILGENGTGKELVARAIHQGSGRKEASFVKVDLGAIPETLFESELFGHKKGAFTDAREDRMGRFEVASGGTLFLDEIGNLVLPLQAKLLSALQNRMINRVGSHEMIPVDIRLVCATNMSLTEMVKEKRFRQDLLYRINTVEIQLPPLRERQSDIPLLTQYYLDLYRRKYQKTDLVLDKTSLQQLQRYPWPGNIRELRHAIERAVILSDGPQLRIADFVLQSGGENNMDQAASLDTYNLEEIERWASRKVMTKHGGNISRAAEELGLTRATLYRRMEKYGL